MKFVITEKQALIEGKGTILMLINLTVKAMVTIMVTLVDCYHMNMKDVMSVIHNCTDIAAEETINITGRKNA